MNAMKVSTFQDRFSELFEESKMTTTQLGKELRVSEQTISAWKVGSRSPKEPTIIMIANYFHVRVEWLMGFDVDRKPNKMAFPDYSQPFHPDVIKLMEEASSPDDYPELVKLWSQASKVAKRAAVGAAIAVLKSMKGDD